MNKIPATSKNISTFIGLIIITALFTWLLVYFAETIKDEPATETIQLKYSKKGLYLYPRYKILVTNSKRPSAVSKEQYESLQIGEDISGFMKNEETFVTEKDIQFEINLGYIILFFLCFVTFLFGALILKGSKRVENNNNYKKIVHACIKVTLFGTLTIYILTGIILVSLIATNIFNKINTSNQIEVDAVVLGGDYNETQGRKGTSYTTYELFIEYQDKQGGTHLTKKAVSGNTYNKYRSNKSIPLTYRKSNVDDTFVQTDGIDEIWPVFLNLYIFFIAFYIASLYFMIKVWRKRRNKTKSVYGDYGQEGKT